MLIRMLFEKDLPTALDLVWSVFCRYEAPEYTQEGVDVFRDFIALDTMTRMMDAGVLRFWGAFDRRRIVGVIAVRGFSHISLLFVDPDFHRKGIARMLFEQVMAFAVTHDCHEITVHSSPYAVSFYENLGFTAIATEQEKQGIRSTPMVCSLPEEQ